MIRPQAARRARAMLLAAMRGKVGSEFET